MSSHIAFLKPRQLAIALAALGSAAAFAQQVNPTEVVLQRLEQTAARTRRTATSSPP